MNGVCRVSGGFAVFPQPNSFNCQLPLIFSLDSGLVPSASDIPDSVHESELADRSSFMSPFLSEMRPFDEAL